MEIKAIETSYKGYRFRSRLEARWAVFFDALGISWDYEREGYSLPSGPYLPDFWLPHLSVWVEIKPEPPYALEHYLAGELSCATDAKTYIFSGPVPGWNGIDDPENQESANVFYPGEEWKYGWDCCHLFCVCPDCGSVGIEFEGRSDRLACKECYHCALLRTAGHKTPYGCAHLPRGCSGKCPRHDNNLDRMHTSDHPRIIAAVHAARSARFGKNGKG